MKTEATIEISKVKILDKGEGCALDYESFIWINDGMERVVTKHKMDSAHKPHKDLIDAIVAATPYALDLVDKMPKPPMDADPKEDYELSRVSGCSFSGEDYERVVFTVLNYTKRGKAYTFNTPLFDTTKNEDYSYLSELVEIIEKIREESEEYIGGKYAPNPQLEMELN